MHPPPLPGGVSSKDMLPLQAAVGAAAASDGAKRGKEAVAHTLQDINKLLADMGESLTGCYVWPAGGGIQSSLSLWEHLCELMFSSSPQSTLLWMKIS